MVLKSVLLFHVCKIMRFDLFWNRTYEHKFIYHTALLCRVFWMTKNNNNNVRGSGLHNCCDLIYINRLKIFFYFLKYVLFLLNPYLCIHLHAYIFVFMSISLYLFYSEINELFNIMQFQLLFFKNEILIGEIHTFRTVSQDFAATVGRLSREKTPSCFYAILKRAREVKVTELSKKSVNYYQNQRNKILSNI